MASQHSSSSSPTFSRAIAKTTAANGLPSYRYVTESNGLFHTFYSNLIYVFAEQLSSFVDETQPIVSQGHARPNPTGCMLSQLQMAPTGFHSVCGTESNQKVAVVKLFAARGDRMAKTLLEKGDVYGQQFVVFESYQAYPMYVVTYTCPDDFTPQLSPRTQVGDVVEDYAFAEVPHKDNSSILIPTTEAYEMGAQGNVRKNLDTIFIRAQHAALSGNHVHVGL